MKLEYTARHGILDSGGIEVDPARNCIIIPIDSPVLRQPPKEIAMVLHYVISQYGLCCEALDIENLYEMTDSNYDSFVREFDAEGGEDGIEVMLQRIGGNPYVLTEIRTGFCQRLLAWQEERRIRSIANQSARIPNHIQRMAILGRDGYRCRYCGVLIKDEFHIDHVIPYSGGGQTVESNLVTACIPCNRRKYSKTLEQAGMALIPLI